MRYLGPAKLIFKGDRAKAKRYVGVARNLLGQLIARMELTGVEQLSWRRKLVDGTSVFVMAYNWGKLIEIDTKGGEPELPPVFVKGFVIRPENEVNGAGWGYPYVDGLGNLIDPPRGSNPGAFTKVVLWNGEVTRASEYGKRDIYDLNRYIWQTPGENPAYTLLMPGDRYTPFVTSAEVYYDIDDIEYQETNKFITVVGVKSHSAWVLGGDLYTFTENMQIYSRPFAEEPVTDGLYDPVLNPFGWELVADLSSEPGELSSRPIAAATGNAVSYIAIEETGGTLGPDRIEWLTYPVEITIPGGVVTKGDKALIYLYTPFSTAYFNIRLVGEYDYTFTAGLLREEHAGVIRLSDEADPDGQFQTFDFWGYYTSVDYNTSHEQVPAKVEFISASMDISDIQNSFIEDVNAGTKVGDNRRSIKTINLKARYVYAGTTYYKYDYTRTWDRYERLPDLEFSGGSWNEVPGTGVSTLNDAFIFENSDIEVLDGRDAALTQVIVRTTDASIGSEKEGEATLYHQNEVLEHKAHTSNLSYVHVPVEISTVDDPKWACSGALNFQYPFDPLYAEYTGTYGAGFPTAPRHATHDVLINLRSTVRKAGSVIPVDLNYDYLRGRDREYLYRGVILKAGDPPQDFEWVYSEGDIQTICELQSFSIEFDNAVFGII